MTQFSKYLTTFVLAIALMGCQNDGSDDTTAEQGPQQQEQTQQQQQSGDQMGQMQQQEAPDVDVSDEEAATFAEAAMSAQEIQMEAQKKMIGIIEDEGLEVETYQKIAQSQQMGQQGGETGDFSDEDMEKYDAATASMEEMQSDIQDDVTAAIEDAGMEMQRFQDISRAAQQDSSLQMKIQEQIQEQMGGEMQQQQPQQQQQQPPQN